MGWKCLVFFARVLHGVIFCSCMLRLPLFECIVGLGKFLVLAWIRWSLHVVLKCAVETIGSLEFACHNFPMSLELNFV